MVELRLPKNSRISSDGVVWDKKKNSAKTLRKFKIYRYNPDDQSEIAYASVYIPGRIILFDGSIPHAIRPQSVKAPKYRFTLSLFFD